MSTREQTTEADRRDIDWAVAQARRLDDRRRSEASSISCTRCCRGDLAAPLSGFSHAAVTRLAMRVQQYSGPVMAKGLEDTAFYRYNRFLALNEVGGSPEKFGVSIAQFHAANQQRAKRTPHAHAQHVHARHEARRGCSRSAGGAFRVAGGMGRARNGVEPHSARARGRVRGARRHRAATTNTPSTSSSLPRGRRSFLERIDEAELDAFRQRIEGAMVKSLREAKLHTTWAAPDVEYENAVLDFVRRALDGSRSNPFLENFTEFLGKVAPLGVANSLVQTVLKLTVPGVPDIYQGAELWDFNLVDPDNRRPVDYRNARRVLEPIRPSAPVAELLNAWQDGRIKQRIVRDLLQLRARFPQLFSEGSYEAIEPAGPASGRLCAFMRRKDHLTLLVVASLYPHRGRTETWDGTEIPVLFDQAGRWLSIFDGEEVPVKDSGFCATELLSATPTAVLLSTRP